MADTVRYNPVRQVPSCPGSQVELSPVIPLAPVSGAASGYAMR